MWNFFSYPKLSTLVRRSVCGNSPPPRKNLTSCNHTISNVNRRSFLKGSAAVAAGLMANNLFDISQVFANPISPGNAPYITQLTPEMIEDNNTGWVYYGAEAKDRPLNPWDKAQMKPEDFDKDALKLRPELPILYHSIPTLSATLQSIFI